MEVNKMGKYLDNIKGYVAIPKHKYFPGLHKNLQKYKPKLYMISDKKRLKKAYGKKYDIIAIEEL